MGKVMLNKLATTTVALHDCTGVIVTPILSKMRGVGETGPLLFYAETVVTNNLSMPIRGLNIRSYVCKTYASTLIIVYTSSIFTLSTGSVSMTWLNFYSQNITHAISIIENT